MTAAASTNSKQRFAARALDSLGARAWLRRFPAWDGLVILNYHRIGDPGTSDLDQNLWSATEADFRAQMAHLKQEFDVIGVDRLGESLQRSRGRSVMITFDDGYRDNYTHAFPVLKDLGLPATFFVTTGFLDQPQVPWWDEIAWMVHQTSVPELLAWNGQGTSLVFGQGSSEDAIRRLLRFYKGLEHQQTAGFLAELAERLQTGRCPPEISRDLWMTWDMVREMRNANMTIGGHSVTHPVLANQTAEQQEFEVRECRRRLMAELGESIDTFSYPVGGGGSFNAVTTDALQRHGYRWGFTYQGGYVRPNRFDRYALPRTAVETDIDLPLFRALLALPQWFA